MKRSVLLFVSGFMIFLQAYSQEIDYARKIITELSSGKYHGRGYVKGGVDKAASFLKKEFTDTGIKSFPGGYGQEFLMPVNTFPGRLTLSFNDKELCPGTDYVVDPFSPSFKGTFGVVSIKKEDLKEKDVIQRILETAKGKVLLIDESSYDPAKDPQKEENDRVVEALKYDPELNHSATIILTNRKLNWSVGTAQASRPVFIVRRNSIENNPEEVKIRIKTRMIPEKEVENIIGYIPGEAEPDTFIVITAHYDHLGRMGKKVYFPGANDNASGVAMMLSLAKHFAVHKPKYSIVFMALAAEEAGILGAKFYVQNPLFPMEQIKFLVNFDLAGTGGEGIKVVNGSIYRDRFNKLKSLNTKNSYLPEVQIRGEACISDHCAFYEAGVPSFYIYTLGGSTAYHDPFDRPENLTLDEFPDYFNLMVRFLEEL